jgi:hypothetical protein
MKTYNLYSFLKEELKNGSSDLVTRQSGQVMRERIEREIQQENDGEIIALDFSQIGIIDYSCADEIIAKLISRLIANEYGNRYILLAGVNDNQRENIEVALERKDLAAMAELRNGDTVLIGNLNNYLRETLELILSKNKISARDLSETMKLEANTSGTRLLNLHKKRLVRRYEELRSGVKVWVYERL